MDALRIWVITLISVSILFSLVEKFAPDGSLNKYVRLVCGLVLTIIIATPVVKFLGGDFEVGEIAWKDYMKLSQRDLEKRVERLEEDDAMQILDVYRDQLEADILDRFSAQKGYRLAAVDLVLQEDYGSKDFGAIRTLYVKVEPADSRSLFDDKTRDSLVRSLSGLVGIGEEKIVVDTSLFDKGGT